MNPLILFSGKKISPGELHRRLVSGEKITIIDVRNPREVHGPQGRLPGAITIPLRELKNKRESAVGFCDGLIVTVCARGLRSLMALSILQSCGKEALSLKGGIRAWKKHGFEIIRDMDPARYPVVAKKEC